MNPTKPLLSIIIPCFNQGKFLADSVKSAQAIPVKDKEIIVVDDGSDDSTAKNAEEFRDVQYYFQKNGGLPAARNKGIELAKGRFVIFLDADDWLIPSGVSDLLNFFIENTHYAFVSGCHIIRNPDGTDFKYCVNEIKGYPYDFLLQGNYIAHPAAVIYRRDILEKFRFENSDDIKGCEDYEQYLRITRVSDVAHKPLFVSVYRRHEGNMSNNKAMMLNSVLNVLNRQREKGLTDHQIQLLQSGMAHWMYHYDFISFANDKGITFQKYHWELLKKYNIKLPVILLRKLRKAVLTRSLNEHPT